MASPDVFLTGGKMELWRRAPVPGSFPILQVPAPPKIG